MIEDAAGAGIAWEEILIVLEGEKESRKQGSEYQDKKCYFFSPSKLRRLRPPLRFSSFLNTFEFRSTRARERRLVFHLCVAPDHCADWLDAVTLK